MKSNLVESHKDAPRPVYNKSLGIYFNGEDNQYPQIIESLIESSPTALQCAGVYESFLAGSGFNVDMSNIDLTDGDLHLYNPNDLLIDIAESISKHQGVFIHVNYNALYQKDSFSVLPFDNCRLGEKDDADYHGKIIVSQKGWGRELNKKELVAIDVFNQRPEVIQAQVESEGGWENYKGQILFYTFQPVRMYPKSLLDTVYLFADVEYQMGLYFNSTTKRGFNDSKLVRHKKFENREQEKKFIDDIRGLMGSENSSSVMLVEDEWDSDNQEGNIKVESITGDIKAEKYQHFEDASANYIRKAFKNIPPQLIEYVQGKLGNTSGEDLLKAQAIYNAATGRDRNKIERLFAILFDNYREDINPGKDWSIKQYALLSDGTTDQ
jgi:hypothetical protein